MMSYTFKITIPDGPLREHLEGRDPKARNFELIRLATNDLVAMHHGRVNIPPSNPNAAKNSVNVEEERSTIEDENMNGAHLQKPKKNKVDYGSDLLNM
tara:strand:+ start:4169 stop:4462 length:294 start_codon:yes stop_codon:yes gene_type:complete